MLDNNDSLTRPQQQVAASGFAFVQADTMHALLAAHGATEDWPAFAQSWNHLGPDPYLATKGRFRRRRHAVFRASANGVITQQPHQPHFQTLQYNALQGDIQRWFDPVEPAVAGSHTLQTILRFCHDFFGRQAPAVNDWHVEMHQFRIEASATAAGEPTPEGSHRDGVDYVLVLLVDRQNIASGTTTIHSPDGQLLGDFTLAHPLEAALIDDHRVYHGVTPVKPLDGEKPAFRDVLVVTFKAGAG